MNDSEPHEMVPFRVRLARPNAATETNPLAPHAPIDDSSAEQASTRPVEAARNLTPRKVPFAPPTAGIGAYSYRVNTNTHELLRNNEHVPITNGPHGPIAPYGQDPLRRMAEAHAIDAAKVAFDLAQQQLDKNRAPNNAKKAASELITSPRGRTSTAPAAAGKRPNPGKGRDQGISSGLSERLHELRTNPMQLDELRAQIREGRRRQRLQALRSPLRTRAHSTRSAVGERTPASPRTLAKTVRAARESARGSEGPRPSEDDETTNTEDSERLRVQESLKARNNSALNGHLERLDVGRKLALLNARRVR